jgi:hypothetical protein
MKSEMSSMLRSTLRTDSDSKPSILTIAGAMASATSL